MELDEETLNASWSENDKNGHSFFIINEAIISKLCILGEECEPCFEGSSITAPTIQFSFEDGFKEQLFSMMKELKDLLNKGGEKVFTRYAVEIGDALWSALYSHIEKAYPDTQNCYCSVYRIEGIFEDNGQKFAVLQSRSDMKYYRLNFALTEDTGFVPSDTLIEVTKSYTPAEEPQFALDAVEEFETEYAKKKKEEEEDKDDKNGDSKPEDKKEGNEEDPDDDEDEEDKKKKKEKKFSYDSLEEIPEYVELQSQYSALEESYNQLKAEKEALDASVSELNTFKLGVERKEKEDMIASFYMLNDEDKADVIANIDTYSLEDIEAKLSVICVRNKVSFNLDDDKKDDITTFNLNGSDTGEEDIPAWVKAALEMQKS